MISWWLALGYAALAYWLGKAEGKVSTVTRINKSNRWHFNEPTKIMDYTSEESARRAAIWKGRHQ
jgi:hypothetical protein